MKDEILTILKRGTYGNPIKSCKIERQLGLGGGYVRTMINHLRCDGVPIGSDTRGYWIAKSVGELESTIDNLNSRAVKILQAQRGLRCAAKQLSNDKLVFSY